MVFIFSVTFELSFSTVKVEEHFYEIFFKLSTFADTEFYKRRKEKINGMTSRLTQCHVIGDGSGDVADEGGDGDDAIRMTGQEVVEAYRADEIGQSARQHDLAHLLLPASTCSRSRRFDTDASRFF